MQFTRGMRNIEAKRYVAEKLGVSALDLVDPVVMLDVRKEFGLGSMYESEISGPDDPLAIEAKFNISKVLDVPINCVERFKEKSGRAAARA